MTEAKLARQRGVRGLAAAGLALCVLLAVVAAAPAVGAASHANAAPLKYVALGDSFSAGEGVAPYLRDGFDPSTGRQGVIDNGCHRSSRAYSTWVKRPADTRTLYAIASGGGRQSVNRGGTRKFGSDRNVRSAGGVAWASWACSGATTRNVLPTSLGGGPQSEPGRARDRRTQLDSANLAGAGLVTLTIGGNDVGFVETLLVCAVSNCETQAFEHGRRAIIDSAKPRLEKVYRAIAARAPRARILVLGYPQLFPATAAEQSCGQLGLFSGEQNMLRSLGAHLNHTIEAAVGSIAKSGARIEYVPVAGRFAGHEVCGRKGAWINGIGTNPPQASDGPAPFHPNLQGQRDGLAASVNAALRSGR